MYVSSVATFKKSTKLKYGGWQDFNHLWKNTIMTDVVCTDQKSENYLQNLMLYFRV